MTANLPAVRSSLPAKTSSVGGAVTLFRDDAQYIAVMVNLFKLPTGSIIADLESFLRMQLALLESQGFKPDVIAEAIQLVALEEDWIPGTSTLVKKCRVIVHNRRVKAAKAARQRAAEARWERERPERERREREERKRWESLVCAIKKHRVKEADLDAARDAISSIVGDSDCRRWLGALRDGEKWAITALKDMASIWSERDQWPAWDGSASHPRSIAWLRFRDIHEGIPASEAWPRWVPPSDAEEQDSDDDGDGV